MPKLQNKRFEQNYSFQWYYVRYIDYFFVWKL